VSNAIAGSKTRNLAGSVASVALVGQKISRSGDAAIEGMS
jgi:hypothetical protein